MEARKKGLLDGWKIELLGRYGEEVVNDAGVQEYLDEYVSFWFVSFDREKELLM